MRSMLVYFKLSRIVTKVLSFFLKVFNGGSGAKTQVSIPSRNQNLDIVEFIQHLKMSSFTQAWNPRKQDSLLLKIVDHNKVFFFFLEGCRVDLMVKLKFPNYLGIRMWIFMTLISIFKSQSITQIWKIIVNKLLYFDISLTIAKLFKF